MLKSVALSAGLIAGANAFWRMECPGRVGLGRMDPIVNPGESSPHSHTIHGSSGFSENADTAALNAGDCTSCRVTQDKSAYWTPPLYFHDADTGKYEIVQQVGGMLAYYLLYGDDIKAFPKGFQMISGSNDRRSYTVGNPDQPDPDKSQWAAMGQTSQSDLEQRALGFNCLNYGKTPEGTLYRHYLPEKSYLDQHCTDGIRLELMFPSCWDGKNVDSSDHKSHVAFPDLVMSGTCPQSHPYRLPSMLFETIFNTNAFKNRNGQFVFSNGDTSGYGYHGDFMTGWDEDFLQQAVNTCTNPSGRIEDCPLFDVVDQGTATSCKLQNSLPKALLGENCVGPMNTLPGDLTMNMGDGQGSDGKGGVKSETSKPVPTLSYKPGDKPAAPASPLPGNIFKEKSKSAAAPTSAGAYAAAAESPDAKPTTPPAASSAKPSYFSTEYITNGNIVTEVLWQEEYVYVTEPAGSAATTAPAAPAAHKHRRGAHHGHIHRKF